MTRQEKLLAPWLKGNTLGDLNKLIKSGEIERLKKAANELRDLLWWIKLFTL